MNDIVTALASSFRLLMTLDTDLMEIAGLSMKVSGGAVMVATAAGLPLGGLLALSRFPGRQGLIVLMNALMGLPPVVAGLLVYLLLSRSGPLGSWGLLFTPAAMILAQSILVIPIIASLSRQVVEDLWDNYSEQLRSLGAGPARAIWTLLWDGRFSLVTAVLAGFGRAIAEVGGIMIVGGNIRHHTRVMTSAIALETSKGDLPLALALGLLLVALAVAVNGAASLTRAAAFRFSPFGAAR
ncbi:MAG: ABC transporter permease [Acidobacteriota bacterium]